MIQLTARQKRILEWLDKEGSAATREVMEMLSREWEEVSRVTVVRDLQTMAAEGLIRQEGRGRSVRYVIGASSFWLEPINPKEYFRKEADQREIKRERVDFAWLADKRPELLTGNEEKEAEELTAEYGRNIKELSAGVWDKEFERITIEFSWKSSAIEGNTYTLLDTEQLLVGGVRAAGHTEEEARMILNHKQALGYIRNNLDGFKELTVADLEDIHRLTVEEMGVETGLRRRPVGIVGTKYTPFDNQYQVREALEGLLRLVNSRTSALEKALLAVAGISYIQPFTDGNKRTGRLAGNALLMAHEMCPLSFRSADEAEYKKAVILFYEQHNLRYFKQIFLEQFRAAVKTYFRAE